MSRKYDRTFSIRVYEGWSEELDTLKMEIERADFELNHSAIVREMVRIENALWTTSPYICLDANHFVLVTAEGEFLYYRGESLRLNHEVQQIPGTLSMKSEKREYFSDPRFSHDDVRKMWLLNRFSLWTGDKPVGSPLVSETDPHGLSTKYVKLNCHLPEGAVVFREGCIALADYAQFLGRAHNQELYDRADILVDIPTRTLEMLVVVDREIYANTKRFGGAQFRPTLRLELRNREEIPFARQRSPKVSRLCSFKLSHAMISVRGAVIPPKAGSEPCPSARIDVISAAGGRFGHSMRSEPCPSARIDVIPAVGGPASGSVLVSKPCSILDSAEVAGPSGRRSIAASLSPSAAGSGPRGCLAFREARHRGISLAERRRKQPGTSSRFPDRPGGEASRHLSRRTDRSASRRNSSLEAAVRDRDFAVARLRRAP